MPPSLRTRRGRKTVWRRLEHVLDQAQVVTVTLGHRYPLQTGPWGHRSGGSLGSGAVAVGEQMVVTTSIVSGPSIALDGRVDQRGDDRATRGLLRHLSAHGALPPRRAQPVGRHHRCGCRQRVQQQRRRASFGRPPDRRGSDASAARGRDRSFQVALRRNRGARSGSCSSRRHDRSGNHSRPTPGAAASPTSSNALRVLQHRSPTGKAAETRWHV